jgi:hypothetical protein
MNSAKMKNSNLQVGFTVNRVIEVETELSKRRGQISAGFVAAQAVGFVSQWSCFTVVGIEEPA